MNTAPTFLLYPIFVTFSLGWIRICARKIIANYYLQFSSYRNSCIYIYIPFCTVEYLATSICCSHTLRKLKQVEITFLTGDQIPQSRN